MINISLSKPIYNTITSAIGAYGLFAFVLWETNPGNWLIENRILCLIIAVAFIYKKQN